MARVRVLFSCFFFSAKETTTRTRDNVILSNVTKTIEVILLKVFGHSVYLVGKETQPESEQKINGQVFTKSRCALLKNVQQFYLNRSRRTNANVNEFPKYITICTAKRDVATNQICFVNFVI